MTKEKEDTKRLEEEAKRLEASLVRNMRLDSASSYGSAVGNKEMQNTYSIITNRMYEEEK